jgi:hypothetical protein
VTALACKAARAKAPARTVLWNFIYTFLWIREGDDLGVQTVTKGTSQV